MLLDCGSVFVLELEGFNVENGLFMGLEESEYLCAFLSRLAVINAQVSDHFLQ